MEQHPRHMQRTSLNRLVIIIINFRTPDLVQDCLKSLRADVQASLGRVIVVDNDSGDGSGRAPYSYH